MHHGFIILARSPYGIVGFKLSSSDTVQLAQSPVGWTHTGCDQPNAKAVRTTKCISGIFCCCLLINVLSPHLTNKSLPQRDKEWAVKRTLLWAFGGVWIIRLCICAADLVCVLARPDGNWHKKRGSVFLFLWARAITSQLELLHLCVDLHGLRNDYCARRLRSKIIDKMANQIQSEELNEPELPFDFLWAYGSAVTSELLILDEVIAKLLLVNIKSICKCDLHGVGLWLLWDQHFRCVDIHKMLCENLQLHTP